RERGASRGPAQPHGGHVRRGVVALPRVRRGQGVRRARRDAPRRRPRHHARALLAAPPRVVAHDGLRALVLRARRAWQGSARAHRADLRSAPPGRGAWLRPHARLPRGPGRGARAGDGVRSAGDPLLRAPRRRRLRVRDPLVPARRAARHAPRAQAHRGPGGVSVADRMAVLVEGGVPPQSVVLLNGAPGTGKSLLALQLLADHVKAGGGALFVTTESLPSKIVDRMPELRGAPNLWFLDAYSWRVAAPPGEANVVAVPGLSDLSTLSIRFSEALARIPAPRLVVFDTASTLALHASASTVLKFFELSFAKARAAGASMLLAVEKGVHEEPFMTALSYM